MATRYRNREIRTGADQRAVLHLFRGGPVLRRGCSPRPGGVALPADDPRAAGAGGDRGADQPARPDRHRHRHAAAAAVAAARRGPDADEHGGPHRGRRRQLLVDEIGDVLDVDAATYERPPENLDPAARELIRGVYKLKDRLLLVLDTERTVDLAVGRAA